MPIYEYRCDACGQSQEAIQKMSDAPLKLCASCGQEALQRVMSRTSFVLKGSGWYATDYKSTSSSTKTESNASESKPSVEAKPSSDTKAT